MFSTDGWIKKCAILIKWKKEWGADTCSGMDYTWKHYDKWKNPVIHRRREQTYGYKGGTGGVGWIGRLGLTYIHYEA